MKSIMRKAFILALSTASMCIAAVNETTNTTLTNTPAASTPEKRLQEQNPQQGQWKNQPQVRAAVTMTPNGPQQTSPYARL